MSKTPPNTDNYTLPTGQKIFFNEGSGERTLGNIAKLDLKHTIDELEHESNQSGQNLVDKTFPIKRVLEFPFSLDEPVLENLRYFFSGADIELVGEGSDNVVDQILAMAGTNPISVGQYYGLTAVTVRQFLDYVFRKESGGTYHDNSAEADTEAGTAFDLITLATDEAYLGKATPFKEFYSDLDTMGSYTGLAVKYWDGTAWTTVSGLTGAGAAFDADGKVQFTLPGDWAKTTINGVSAYFLQITVSGVTTPATVNCFRQNLVEGTDHWLIPGFANSTGKEDGKVVRISTGMLVDGEEVKVSFTYVTWTSRQLALSAQGFIEGSARIEIFPDPGLGIRKEYIIPKCQIKPNGDISEDSKNVEQVPMTLKVLADMTAETPSGTSAPYGYLIEYED